MLTFSEHRWNANFTLADETDLLQVRIRTSETDDNAWPPIEIPGGFAAAKAHYVVTFADGIVRVYRNAELLAAETHEGDLSSWDSSFGLDAAGVDAVLPNLRSFPQRNLGFLG